MIWNITTFEEQSIKKNQIFYFFNNFYFLESEKLSQFRTGIVIKRSQNSFNSSYELDEYSSNSNLLTNQVY